MTPNTAIKLDEEKSVKKGYQSPQLVIYGSIGEVTRMVNPTGAMNDNAPKTAKDKT